MKELYAAFFAWVDGLPVDQKRAVMDRWRDLNDRTKLIDWCAETQGFQKPALVSPLVDPSTSVPFSLTDAHPKFCAWYEQQSPGVQAAVQEKWISHNGSPDISWGSTHAKTAVLSSTMKWCAEQYGYDFTP